jgi:putative oxidoreductase
MNKLLELHSTLFDKLETSLGPWLLPTLARFTFTATLLIYFLNSATLKIGDGFFGFLDPSPAYGQIFPKVFDAVGYDPDAMSLYHWLVALLGTWAEFILPVLLLVGLLTRLAATGMIGFIVVQSLTDIFGHDATEYGAWFDRLPDGVIMDQRLFWVTVLLIPVIRGAGPLSLDHILRRNRP